jgi:hypothetical protein
MANKMLEAALWYRAKKKYSVIPIRENDKRPLVQWEQYQKELPSIEQVTEWFTKWPNANIAIITGEISGITVVDIDTKEGMENFNLVAPDTMEVPIVKTPSKHGVHYYFAYTPGIVNKARIIEGTDIRNDGGYVVAPPSTIDGKQYKWEKV